MIYPVSGEWCYDPVRATITTYTYDHIGCEGARGK